MVLFFREGFLFVYGTELCQTLLPIANFFRVFFCSIGGRWHREAAFRAGFLDALWRVFEQVCG